MKNTYLISLLIVVSAIVTLGLSAAHADACETLSLNDKIQKAMKLKDRTESDISRDRNRQPAKALEFMGFKTDMKVIEFNPGNNFWYTKLLEPLLRDEGELIVAGNNAWMEEWLENIASARLNKVKRIAIDMDWSNEKREFLMDVIDFKTSNADMLLNIREYHNLPNENRSTFNKAVYKALKPGGTYVVIDHTRRHMKEDSFEVYRREDPVRVIKEITDAGFNFTKYSNMFYRPDDHLNLELRRKSVRGNSDRFFLVFNKPK
jgi:predicted methyltransferase